MEARLYDPDAPEKSTNLSVNCDLLRQAKEHRIDLSKALEQRLSEILMDKRRQQWQEENRDAISRSTISVSKLMRCLATV